MKCSPVKGYSRIGFFDEIPAPNHPTKVGTSTPGSTEAGQPLKMPIGHRFQPNGGGCCMIRSIVVGKRPCNDQNVHALLLISILRIFYRHQE